MFSNFFGRSDSQGESSIKWNELNDLEQIGTILEESKSQPVLIFKHSYSCGTSAMMLDRLQRKWNQEEVSELKPYFLDLLSNRNVSNQLAETFGVWHQSPQILIIHGGKCIYDISHMGISFEAIKAQLAGLETT